jgi:hypothetical protein
MSSLEVIRIGSNTTRPRTPFLASMNQDRRALKFQADIRMSLHRTLCAAGNQCLPAGYKSDKLTSGKRPKGYKTVILQ